MNTRRGESLAEIKAGASPPFRCLLFRRNFNRDVFLIHAHVIRSVRKDGVCEFWYR
jgi:hypothetical protein